MNYQNDFDKLLTQLDFKQEEVFKQNAESGDFLIRGIFQGKKVVLKVVSKEEPAKIRKIKKEFFVDRLLPNLNTTRMIVEGETELLFYGIRQYLDAQVLSGQNVDQTLFGYDQIDPKYAQNWSILNQIISSVDQIRAVSVAKAQEVFASEFTCKRYKLCPLEKKTLPQMPESVWEQSKKSIEYFNDNYKLLKDEVVSNGDLNPANVLIEEDGKVCLIDLEWFGVENRMYDIAFFWLFLWRYPEWQKRWLENYLKTEEDQKLFQLNLIYLIGNCAWFNRFEKFEEKYGFTHAWLSYLQNAWSFEKINNLSFQGLK